MLSDRSSRRGDKQVSLFRITGARYGHLGTLSAAVTGLRDSCARTCSRILPAVSPCVYICKSHRASPSLSAAAGSGGVRGGRPFAGGSLAERRAGTPHCHRGPWSCPCGGECARPAWSDGSRHNGLHAALTSDEMST